VEVVGKLDRLKAIKMKIVWTNQKGEVVSKGETLVIPPG
jgi:hypothetical protein